MNKIFLFVITIDRHVESEKYTPGEGGRNVSPPIDNWNRASGRYLLMIINRIYLPCISGNLFLS